MIAIALAATGCVSKQALRPERGPVDQQIPQEIVKAYEVSETPRGEAAGAAEGKAPSVMPEAPTLPVAAEPAGKKKKTRKERAKKASAPPAPAIPSRRPAVDPFRQGEKVTFDVSWLKTTAGELILEVLPLKYIEGRRVYHFRGTARTTSLVASFYRADDFVESFVDYEGLYPYKFILHGDETKHIRDNLELYDHLKGKQYVYIKDDRLNGDVKEEKGIKDLTPFSQDTLSALFYLRTLDMKKDRPVVIPVATSGHMSDFTLTWVGNEEVKTKAGRFNARKIKVHVHYKREKKYGENVFWVTDDDRRLIVKFEMKVRIGWMGGEARAIELGVPFAAAQAAAQ